MDQTPKRDRSDRRARYDEDEGADKFYDGAYTRGTIASETKTTYAY
jgi:hypothetical protein